MGFCARSEDTVAAAELAEIAKPRHDDLICQTDWPRVPLCVIFNGHWRLQVSAADEIDDKASSKVCFDKAVHSRKVGVDGNTFPLQALVFVDFALVGVHSRAPE